MSGFAPGFAQSWLMNTSSASLSLLNGVNVITLDLNIVTFSILLAFSSSPEDGGRLPLYLRASTEGDWKLR